MCCNLLIVFLLSRVFLPMLFYYLLFVTDALFLSVISPSVCGETLAIKRMASTKGSTTFFLLVSLLTIIQRPHLKCGAQEVIPIGKPVLRFSFPVLVEVRYLTPLINVSFLAPIFFFRYIYGDWLRIALKFVGWVRTDDRNNSLFLLYSFLLSRVYFNSRSQPTIIFIFV